MNPKLILIYIVIVFGCRVQGIYISDIILIRARILFFPQINCFVYILEFPLVVIGNFQCYNGTCGEESCPNSHFQIISCPSQTCRKIVGDGDNVHFVGKSCGKSEFRNLGCITITTENLNFDNLIGCYCPTSLCNSSNNWIWNQKNVYFYLLILLPILNHL